MEEAAKLPNVLNTEDHKTVVRFSDFEASDLLFKIFLWVDDVKNQFKVGSDYREAILREFTKAKKWKFRSRNRWSGSMRRTRPRRRSERPGKPFPFSHYDSVEILKQ